MIDDYLHEIEDCLFASPIIINHEVHLTNLSPFTAYLEGEAVFTDGSEFFFFEFLRSVKGETKREKYRYQYQSISEKLIFRYDNAPHFRRVKTFPNHKHLKDSIINSMAPNLKKILKEIEKIVLDLPNV